MFIRLLLGFKFTGSPDTDQASRTRTLGCMWRAKAIAGPDVIRQNDRISVFHQPAPGHADVFGSRALEQRRPSGSNGPRPAICSCVLPSEVRARRVYG